MKITNNYLKALVKEGLKVKMGKQELDEAPAFAPDIAGAPNQGLVANMATQAKAAPAPVAAKPADRSGMTPQAKQVTMDIQNALGIKADGIYGKQTEAAVAKWFVDHPNVKRPGGKDFLTAITAISQVIKAAGGGAAGAAAGGGAAGTAAAAGKGGAAGVGEWIVMQDTEMDQLVDRAVDLLDTPVENADLVAFNALLDKFVKKLVDTDGDGEGDMPAYEKFEQLYSDDESGDTIEGDLASVAGEEGLAGFGKDMLRGAGLGGLAGGAGMAGAGAGLGAVYGGTLSGAGLGAATGLGMAAAPAAGAALAGGLGNAVGGVIGRASRGQRGLDNITKIRAKIQKLKLDGEKWKQSKLPAAPAAPAGAVPAGAVPAGAVPAKPAAITPLAGPQGARQVAENKLRISKSYLQQVIKEELQTILNEQGVPQGTNTSQQPTGTVTGGEDEEAAQSRPNQSVTSEGKVKFSKSYIEQVIKEETSKTLGKKKN
jgi:hypothetical protein